MTWNGLWFGSNLLKLSTRHDRAYIVYLWNDLVGRGMWMPLLLKSSWRHPQEAMVMLSYHLKNWYNKLIIPYRLIPSLSIIISFSNCLIIWLYEHSLSTTTVWSDRGREGIGCLYVRHTKMTLDINIVVDILNSGA